MIIAGAGLSGLIAACAFPGAPIWEKNKVYPVNHKALLRFRNNAVAELTGIPFRQVRVRKAIFHDGEFRAPNIQLANMYSEKVTGSLQADRSIWNIDPADRYIAPDDFIEQLVDRFAGRIHLGENIFERWCATQTGDRMVLSTIPLPVTLAELGIEFPAEFKREAVIVEQYRVPHCDLFQTIYFPGHDLSVYRASITGNTLIIEAMALPNSPSETTVSRRQLMHVCSAFGLVWQELEPITSKRMEYGKITPVADGLRKAALMRLTAEHRIFSIGRFATWRNILLDDLPNDIKVIKSLMRGDDYQRILKGMNQ